jgi:acyl-[acyl-carrier-protein]-phospholipid O-acyltransferase/long-chain-fatty-acid--[acyl-carrier-protein] ligase
MGHDPDTLALMRQRRFLPLFLTQFLGAANDSLFKQALFVLIVFRLADAAGANAAILVNIGAGLFILPFFLFSATGGQLADKVEKSRLIRWIKLGEILIMALAALGFYLADSYFLLAVLFLMGAQSAFFGPVKYSILPDLLPKKELVSGNAYIEAGTFLAILIGTLAGNQLILIENGDVIVTAAVLALAVFGFATSFFIPKAGPAAPALRINGNILAETLSTMRLGRSRRDIHLSILGISWFWLFGATFLAQLSPFTKDYLLGNEEIIALFMTLFSIGIGAGSFLCNRLLRGEISARYVPLGAIGMAVFSLDLYFASRAGMPATGALVGVVEFLQHGPNWRIAADLLLIAVSGGVFVVPLYAILQTRSDESVRSRMIAANNIINAMFMVAGAIAATAMLAFAFTIPEIFLTVAVVTILVAIYICGLLPDELVKVGMAGLLRLAYRVELRGRENYGAVGERAVIVVNHVSFLDGLLLAAFLPGKPVFAVNTHIATSWWAKPFLAMVETFPMDPTKPMAAKSLIKTVQSGKKCVIFPEGRITVTGALMKVYEGPAMVADKSEAPILPVRIDGAQYSPFSRIRDKVRTRLFPKITITVMEPRQFDVPHDMHGRKRRQLAGTKLHAVMAEMIFATCDTDRTLFEGLLEARGIHGGKQAVLEDVERRPADYRRVVRGSLVLGRRLSQYGAPGKAIGVLLPNSVGTAIVFFAFQANGQVPAMLNFSTGAGTMISACKTAEIGTVVTSRRFIRLAKLTEAVDELSQHAAILYVEDIIKSIGRLDKIYAVFAGAFARSIHRRCKRSAGDPAVILFTSGSEGAPKGVVLSHRNILSNVYQLGAVVDFNPSDIVFNALPMFHSFGLSAGMLLPALSGIRTFLYPSPLHYRIVPELVYDTNATIMFGTDTFLTGYARMAHPYDFYSIRYVFAGAERVKAETRATWAEKFGLRILEGYGATETSPVLTTNTPMHYRAGTVGRFLPGIVYKLEPVQGIERGGQLLVSGPNVMLGYLRAEKPGRLEPVEDGWYDTGDIVEIDETGFVTIAGRAKRFAKIAGEMVSLAVVENNAAAAWPDYQHAAVSIEDDRKGEQIILVTDNPTAEREALLRKAQELSFAEITVPRTILIADTVPLLGTGKIDYVAVKALALDAAAKPGAASIGGSAA